MYVWVFLAWLCLDYLTGDSIKAMWLLIGGIVCYFLFLVVLDIKTLHKQQGPRETALAEASYGAAMIVLPVVAYWDIGRALPPWFPFAVLALMVAGALKFFRGAKYSVGWRDPVLMARFAAKIGL